MLTPQERAFRVLFELMEDPKQEGKLRFSCAQAVLEYSQVKGNGNGFNPEVMREAVEDNMLGRAKR
jgi:hypothetical protein